MYVVALRVLYYCSMMALRFVRICGSYIMVLGTSFKIVKKTRSLYILHVEAYKLRLYRFSLTIDEDLQILQ